VTSYESILIFKPELPVEEVDKIVSKLEKMILGGPGEIVQIDKWGLRKTAYPVKKYKEGFFTYLNYKTSPAVANSLDKTFLVTDGILRGITTKIKRPRRIKVKKEKIKVAAPEPKVEG